MSRTKELILVGILLLITLVTRFYRINTVPINIHPDGMDAARLYLLWNENNRGDFWSKSNWNGTFVINNYFLTVPWDLLGRPFWGMRVAPAITSVFVILIFFYTIKQLTRSSAVSFMTSILLATDPWFLNFSRSSWENIANALIVIALVYAFSLRKRKIRLSFIITIICTVITPYLYHPGKVIFFVGVALYCYYLVSIYQAPVKKKILILLFGLSAISLGVLPLVMNFSSVNFGRINNVSVFSERNPIQVIKQNFIKSSLALVTFNGNEWHVGINDRYLPTGGQVMYIPLVIMFWLGVLIAAIKAPQLVVVFILLFFPINLLSIGTPDAARSVHIVPLIYTFIAYGIAFIFVNITQALNKCKFCAGSFKLLIIICVFLLSAKGYEKYWNWINLESTALLREPSIFLYEYQEWLSTTVKLTHDRGINQSIGEWRAEHPIPSPHMRR